MDDFNSIINYKLTEFINNLNKKYNTSLNINHYIINDEDKRCINRINDCGKNKTLNINRQCSRAVLVNNLCRQCACSDKETGNVNENPPEWLVNKYQLYIDKHPREFKDRNIKNEINLDKYELFIKKKSKKKELTKQRTDDLCIKVSEEKVSEEKVSEVIVSEEKVSEIKKETILIDLKDTTNRFEDTLTLSNGKAYYTIYLKNEVDKNIEIGSYSFIKIENITHIMKNYNITKEMMDINNFMLHPETNEKCLQIEIFEHDYKNYHWLPKIYYECDYNKETNKINVNDCISDKDYC